MISTTWTDMFIPLKFGIRSKWDRTKDFGFKFSSLDNPKYASGLGPP